MNMSIVDYESKVNDDEDDFPELNIYEKIQMIILENQYIIDNNNYLPNKSIDNKKNNSTPPILIPKKK